MILLPAPNTETVYPETVATDVLPLEYVNAPVDVELGSTTVNVLPPYVYVGVGNVKFVILGVAGFTVNVVVVVAP